MSLQGGKIEVLDFTISCRSERTRSEKPRGRHAAISGQRHGCFQEIPAIHKVKPLSNAVRPAQENARQPLLAERKLPTTDNKDEMRFEKSPKKNAAPVQG
ncbi:hypothetical protein [Pseudomonas sp. v388]|uniref:hypothetical protein n=1 Tax=Pseudomonas sp. v388 TaxID=2479849 RepID=UPI00211463CF|nr:hypothetical protein [Pseudomonas sp. v388]